MTIVTPIDGQPALAEHVAQLTESLTGVRAEPITLQGNLLVNGATYDLGATGARWRKLWAADGEFTNPPTVGGVALPTAAGVAATYLPLTGGSVMTGLLGPTTTNTRDLGTTALAWRTAYLGTALAVGTNPASAGAIRLANAQGLTWRNAANSNNLGGLSATPGNLLQTDITLIPASPSSLDLGTTALRWNKVWSDNGEFTNPPTVGGVALPTSAGIATLYLPLAGGSVVTGALGPTVTNTNDLGTTALKWRSAYLGTVLSVAGASATANQATFAITTDAQPRLIIDGNGKHSWGPGASTTQDTTLERVGAGLLRAETSLGIGGTPPVAHTARRGLLIGDAAYIMGGTAYNGAEYRVNSYQDASNVTRAITANAGGSLALVNDTLTYANAPSVGAGAAQTMTARLAINASGNVALTPAASTAAISIGGTAQPKITVAAAAPSSPMTGDVWFW